MVDSKEETVDITGKNRDEVVEQLTKIINDKKRYRKGETFRFKISGETKFELKANPTPDQPGNGYMKVFNGSEFIGRSYDAMVDDLKEAYRTNISSFAKDLKELFEKNSHIAKYKFAVTSEVYILLLFEIARRKVKGSTQALDKLPIGDAVTNLIRLMEASSCTFEDIFLKNGQFHCFSSLPEKRKKAIKNIESKLRAVEHPQTGASETEEFYTLTKEMGDMQLNNSSPPNLKDSGEDPDRDPDEDSDEDSKGAGKEMK